VEHPWQSSGSMEATKVEVLGLLRRVAASRAMITYEQLCAQIKTVKTFPADVKLHNVLSQISRDEAAQDRGLLSVVVISKQTGKPGPKFFLLASELGRDVADQRRFLEEEYRTVYASL
jgi:hypothetical protein